MASQSRIRSAWSGLMALFLCAVPLAPEGGRVAAQCPAPPAANLTRFTRADSNADTQVEIDDPIHTQNFLFFAGEAPECMDAADSNDDGRVNLADSIYTLNYLFRGGPRPPAPFNFCGVDPTLDALVCGSTPCLGGDVSMPNVSQRDGAESETAVAVNPLDPNNVVIVSKRTDGAAWQGLYRAVTFDGGATWATGDILDDNHSVALHDPALAFDRCGNLFLAYGGVYRATEPVVTGAYLAVSVDCGVTFPRILRTRLAGGGDRPTVATGPAPSAEQPTPCDPCLPCQDLSESVWIANGGGGRIAIWGFRVNGLISQLADLGVPATEEDCDDGIDNDGDGQIDCADPSCCGFAPCAPCAEPEDCDDGKDNDGDGDVDCEDLSCNGIAPCGPWTIEPLMEEFGSFNYPSLAVGPAGEVMVAYQNGAQQAPTRPIEVFTQLRGDGSLNPPVAGFDPPVLVAESNVAPTTVNHLGRDRIPARPGGAPQDSRGISADPVVAWDRRASGLGSGRAYLAYLDKPSLDLQVGNQEIAIRLNVGGMEVGGWLKVTGGSYDYTGTPPGVEDTLTEAQNSSEICAPAPDEVYSTVRRSGNAGVGEPHAFDVGTLLDGAPFPNGTYFVRIHFSSGASPGQTFNLTIEDVPVLTAFNPVTAPDGGENTVVVREFNVTVTDGDGMQIVSTPNPVGSPGDSSEAAIEIYGEDHDTDVILLVADAPLLADWEPWNAASMGDGRVNTDAPGNSQFFHRLALDQNSGHLALSWYDTRPGLGQPMALCRVRFFATHTTALDPVAFRAEFPVLTDEQPAQGDARQGTLGDYTGLDFGGGFFYPAWANNSGAHGNPDPGEPDVFTTRVQAGP